MTSWVSRNREDILFIVGLAVGVLLTVVGVVRGEVSTMMLGAGALGIGGFNETVKDSA